ncbi:MAG: hypothetical protein LBR18_08450, partial [Tannerella sp.]|nr:hypothetical protein [Tannerella sp.]
MKKYEIFFCMAAAVALLSCQNRESEQAEKNSFSTKDNIITVAADAPLLKHIKTETVTETDFQAVFKTAGTVRAVPSR